MVCRYLPVSDIIFTQILYVMDYCAWSLVAHLTQTAVYGNSLVDVGSSDRLPRFRVVKRFCKILGHFLPTQKERQSAFPYPLQIHFLLITL
jgi:hypothetical protein